MDNKLNQELDLLKEKWSINKLLWTKGGYIRRTTFVLVCILGICLFPFIYVVQLCNHIYRGIKRLWLNK